MSTLILILRWFTLATWLFWLVMYWEGGRRVVSDIQKSAMAGNSRLDMVLLIGITLLLSVLVLTGLAVSLGWVTVQSWARNGPVTLLGTLLTLLGMLGTFYCRSYLGRFWTAETTLQPGHQVVDSGPYGVVRHPIYTTALMMYLGTVLVFATWWNWLVYGLLVVAYVLKTRSEEVFLAANLAPDYWEYQRRVRYRLIPGVW